MYNRHINAVIRIAEKNLTSYYIVKRGDEQAGAIFVKIDTLDGFAKLFSRNIKYDLNNDKEIIENKKVMNLYSVSLYIGNYKFLQTTLFDLWTV